MKQKVALVAGVTGLVGNCLSELLRRRKWKVYGVARRPKPEWFVHPGVEYVQCDLLDRDDTVGKLSQLTDVTHIFWVVWVHKSDTDEQVNCEANGSMLSNALEALLPVARQLEHICLQTGSKHYVGPESLWGKIKLHSLVVPFVEDSPRLGVPNFYYTLEDIVFSVVAAETKKKRKLTWSVHRPSVIFGFAPRSPINLVQSIAIYASVCKHTGLPFVFPGHPDAWECGTDVSDAELIAEQEIWASTEPAAKNQAFNVTNGDVITWKQLWRCMGAKFGIEVPVYCGKPTSVEAVLCDKEKEWQEIVKAEHLVQSSSLRTVGRVMDEAFNFPFRLLSSNEKSRRLGFHGCRNTEVSLLRLIDKMRANGIIPP